MEESKKQQAIIAAYGEHWETVKQNVDENGFLEHPKGGEVTFDPFIGFMEEHPSKDAFRPVSLSRIENNNGWELLPAKDLLPYGWYFVRLFHPVAKIEDITVYHLNSGSGILPFHFGTHYKHIELNHPIY